VSECNLFVFLLISLTNLVCVLVTCFRLVPTWWGFQIIDKTLRKFSRVELQDYLEEVSSDKKLFKSQLQSDPYLGPLFDSTRSKRKKTIKGYEYACTSDEHNILFLLMVWGCVLCMFKARFPYKSRRF
jgi:hypothetical protein